MLYSNLNFKASNAFADLTSRLRKFSPWIVSITLAILMIGRVIYFASVSEEYAIGGIGDDTFYYQKLACNFVDGSGWSFDGDTNTTGFHLLFAYLLVIFNGFLGCEAWRLTFLLIGLIASISISISCFITLSISRKFFGQRGVLAGSIPFISPTVFLQVTSLMESWIVILISSISFGLCLNYCVSRINSDKISFQSDNHSSQHFAIKLLLCFLIGFVGVLARTDSIIYLAALFAGTLLWGVSVFKISIFRSKNIHILFGSSSLLVGGILGLIFVAVHNSILIGNFDQSSASTKLFWSSVMGHTPLPILKLAAIQVGYIYLGDIRSFGDIGWFKGMFFGVACLITLVLAIKTILEKMYRNINTSQLCVGVNALGCLVFFVVFYSFNSQAIQPWYISQILVPISLLSSFLGSLLFSSSSPAILIAMLLLGVIQSVSSIFHTRWPHQEHMLYAGRILNENYKKNKIASWNSGIISFFSGRKIVNIDGLVNNEILPYIKANNLALYIKEKEIDYVVDFEVMLKKSSYMHRGGYWGGKLTRCLEKVDKINSNAPKWEESRMYIFKVKNDCL